MTTLEYIVKFDLTNKPDKRDNIAGFPVLQLPAPALGGSCREYSNQAH
jgi:hypothetical protein